CWSCSHAPSTSRCGGSTCTSAVFSTLLTTGSWTRSAAGSCPASRPSGGGGTRRRSWPSGRGTAWCGWPTRPPTRWRSWCRSRSRRRRALSPARSTSGSAGSPARSPARRLAATAAGVLALRRLLHRDVLARLRRVERLVLGGALTGAVIAVLTRQMPWYRCRNVQRFMRGVCRSPFGSLDWLFALAALVVVALDPVRMLHLAEDAEDELSAIIARMAGVVRG